MRGKKYWHAVSEQKSLHKKHYRSEMKGGYQGKLLSRSIKILRKGTEICTERVGNHDAPIWNRITS